MFYRGSYSLHPITLKIVLFHSHVYVRCIHMYACLYVCGHMRVDAGNQPQWLIILFKDRASQSHLELTDKTSLTRELDQSRNQSRNPVSIFSG